MKMLRCKDFGTRCDFISVGNDSDDVKNGMLQHIQEEHKDFLAEMSEDERKDLEERIEVLLSRGCGCGAL